MRPELRGGAPRGLPRSQFAEWADLDTPTETRGYFLRSALDGLPEPVQRWLTRTTVRGSRLLTSVELQMHGQLKIRDWVPFRATQRINATRGFIWAATARLSRVVPVSGSDRYTGAAGQMRWSVGGVVPLIRASGLDVTRSAAGRFAAELLVAAPAAALSRQVTWRPLDPDRAVAQIDVEGELHEVTVMVGPTGLLRCITLQRWGNPDGGPCALHTFGADLEGETRFDGFTIPYLVTAGWHHGTDRWAEGQFIRYTLDRAGYR